MTSPSPDKAHLVNHLPVNNSRTAVAVANLHSAFLSRFYETCFSAADSLTYSTKLLNEISFFHRLRVSTAVFDLICAISNHFAVTRAAGACLLAALDSLDQGVTREFPSAVDLK